ncbi:S phase cyclin A-associated protein in the endoplasmic reticulum isoform X5 [Tachysurus fulvidraco]|uniref:S phase cyclin A-associated protein in the endoplasmic reticulum isoform X5 n=1 Tax=Tachysurus fulvidraco TaxID=1234273 RepID=UPI001FEF61B7|nr:S phase cyclin A-associated protein in the endoplasmic reticulum isoform X5 [Tachysurus fulvidraco]
MSKDSRYDGRRRGGAQHRGGQRADTRERSGSNSSGSSHGGGKGRSASINAALKASFQRSNSHDKVRKIVAEEGRAARNLIAWSVPLENKEEEGKFTHINGKSRAHNNSNARAQRINSGQHRNKKQPVRLDCKAASGSMLEKRPEKSPTKARQPRKVDLRARYWAFLFDNLRRAVDEIYVMCESDQSVVECKEVLMMLDNYVRDFKALIDWIQLQEKLEKTDAQNRPTSLAWEVRKMSPGRHVMPSPSKDRLVPSPSVRRTLNFGGPPPTLAVACLSHSGLSYADRVKCSQALPVPNQSVSVPTEKPGKKDAEGWETVQRGRSMKPRAIAMVAKVSPVLANVSLKNVSDKGNQLQDKTQRPEERQGDSKLISPEQNPECEKASVLEPSSDSDQQSSQNVPAPLSESPLAPSSPQSPTPTPALEPPPTSPQSEEPGAGLVGGEQEPAGAACWVTAPSAAEEGAAVTASATQIPLAEVKLESMLDPTELSTPQSMAEVLAKKEELADRLEKANEEAIASAIAEEEQLTREIQAENNELERDNESDFSVGIGSGGCGLNLEWSEVLADYEAREPWRQSTSWGDMVEEEPARPPGHGIHMHEKLSSPSRKRTIAESKKKHEEKQLKAQQLRDKMREEKSHKLQKLLEREKEVRKWKEELLDQRRRMMDEKLLHAEFKRELQLQAIVKKAQEEEAKVNEIAFINTLEAQNKRHDMFAKLKEYKQRLNELQEERQRRQEEKQARDEAVQERKRALEAERQARVEELLMKRREQEARIEQQRQEKERAREDAARERARDREERMAALSAAQQEAMEELQKKIQMKHDESSRRHMEQIEQRKEKAAELSSGRHANTDYAPKLTPYECKKQCSLCGVVITSEVHLFSHTKGKRHQQAVRESSSIQGRELSDEEVNNADQVAFQVGGGLSALEQILQVVTAASTPTAVPRIPLKSLYATVNVYSQACSHCYSNCFYIFYSNKITPLLDLLLHQLTLYVPEEDKSIFGRTVNKQIFEGLTTGLLQTIATVVNHLEPAELEAGKSSSWIWSPDMKTKSVESFTSRAQDLISYVVNMGVIDQLYGCFLSVQGPVDESPKMSAFLEQATAFLLALCKLCFVVNGRSSCIFDNKRQDPTGLTALLQNTDLVGVLHMLYCILLHSTESGSVASLQEPYSPAVIQVALQGLRFLNSFALLDLTAFQSVLGAEGLSLAFRHIVSSLLWYCSQNSSEELLHEVIICVGYFTVNHPDNQVIVQSGRQPSVLQKLCLLPFQYFSHPHLIKVLFPSLISACYNNQQNKVMLQQEMSCVLLATFIQDCASSEIQTDNSHSNPERSTALPNYCELANRFPRDQWDSALQFFLNKQEE